MSNQITIKYAMLHTMQYTLTKKKTAAVDKEWCDEECKKAVETRRKAREKMVK